MCGASLIEAAESYNMMNELGYWTLEQAFKNALQFKMQGIEIVLAVNMSPTQLYDTNFIPTLKALSESYCVDLDQLVITYRRQSVFALMV